MQRRSLLATAAALAGCSGLPPASRVGAGADGAAAALPADRVLTRLGFGSCIDQTQPQTIWRAVRAARPDLFLFCGDNVYASEQPWSRDRLESAYAQLAANADFAALRREVPALAIWDDHDYGLNDGGADFPHRAASKQAFLRFWREPSDSERRTRDGLYGAWTYGPPGRCTQIILLDTRWFRSPLKPSPQRGTAGMERYVPDADPAKTLLGEPQWAWLEAQLRQPADLRIVVSSIQVLADGHGWERWGNLPLERQRLYSLIGRTGARGVLLLSGDRHIGGIYREATGTPYPLVECTSSGITHVAAQNREAGPNRLGAPVTELHAGQLDIDWAQQRLRLSLRGQAGQLLREHSVALAELAPR